MVSFLMILQHKSQTRAHGMISVYVHTASYLALLRVHGVLLDDLDGLALEGALVDAKADARKLALAELLANLKVLFDGYHLPPKMGVVRML